MTDLPEKLFLNPVWHSLRGPHSHLAVDGGAACRYPAEVAPFAAVAEHSAGAQRQLHALLGGGESLWMAAGPRHPALEVEAQLDCLQMVLPPQVPLAPRAGEDDIVALSGADAEDMVALTDAAFPGFFRPATHRMGCYAGIRRNGRLIAMAGERLRLEGFPELSGICTHPEHRGQGLAAALINHRVRAHRLAGLTTWLHVGVPNVRAIDLYRGLGFEPVRTLTLSRIRRAD